MEFIDFMKKNFPDLELNPPLFYNWHIGIRFELGVGYRRDDCSQNSPYLKGVYRRAITLFDSLHLPEDEIFVVVNVNDFGDNRSLRRKLNIFSRYIRHQSVLNKLEHMTLPYIIPEDDKDGNYKTHRFVLKCKVSDLRYMPLLKAICNNDMGYEPAIYHDVFFISLKQKTIFHVYDDRGCDLVAASPEDIRHMYDTHNAWILNYDRDEIDQVFR
ncbi:DUF3885 domain-containing protein [Planococcus donghaensis]|uniref:DUF3885 domain-containing protein n=1 Tax=Planococcus donghaensis TaxID=414778 RepID=UPI003734F4B4